MKKILLINGSGGVGKDTFVGCLNKITNVIHTSIVNPTKIIASIVGWNGAKEEKDRKFLADLKSLIDNYNDANYKFVAAIMQDFLDGKLDSDILCIDMREKRDIDKAKSEFGAKSVLVTRDAVERISSNHADGQVFGIEYDFKISNNGTLEDLQNIAKDFLVILTK